MKIKKPQQESAEPILELPCIDAYYFQGQIFKMSFSFEWQQIKEQDRESHMEHRKNLESESDEDDEENECQDFVIKRSLQIKENSLYMKSKRLYGVIPKNEVSDPENKTNDEKPNFKLSFTK